MISQSNRWAHHPGWLRYSGWAERHFVTQGMTEGEKNAMKAGLALGWDAGKREI